MMNLLTQPVGNEGAFSPSDVDTSVWLHEHGERDCVRRMGSDGDSDNRKLISYPPVHSASASDLGQRALGVKR